MANKEVSPKEDPAKAPKSESEPRKRRRHGYRGYPNNPSGGGDIHWGSGFAGTGSTGGSGGATLPTSGVLTERTREDVKKLEDEDTLDKEG